MRCSKWETCNLQMPLFVMTMLKVYVLKPHKLWPGFFLTCCSLLIFVFWLFSFPSVFTSVPLRRKTFSAFLSVCLLWLHGVLITLGSCNWAVSRTNIYLTKILVSALSLALEQSCACILDFRACWVVDASVVEWIDEGSVEQARCVGWDKQQS